MSMSAAQGIREETRREQSAELKQGDVKWEVEVSLLQINLCSATAAGRFLLAAQKCQLSGSQLPASQRKALCIDMQARALPELPWVDDGCCLLTLQSTMSIKLGQHTVRVLPLKVRCCCAHCGSDGNCWRGSHCSDAAVKELAEQVSRLTHGMLT